MDTGRVNKKETIDAVAVIQFLKSILEKAEGFLLHIDTQTNILIGVSSAIFLFAVTQYNSNGKFHFLILSIFSSAAVLVALLATHPPRFMRKRGQQESLMYNKSIVDLSSAGQYAEKLGTIVSDEGAVIEQYATEIYNLYKYSYRPKRSLYKVSRNILFLGILLSLIAFVLSIAIHPRRFI